MSTKQEKILVTGGLGAVGTPLVADLRSRGHEVWVCDLPHHHDPQYFKCDIGIYRQLERVIETVQPAYVYNLAAEFGRWNGEDFYETLWHTNVIGAKNLLRLQEKHKFRAIYFSSSEVYGDWDGVMSEDVMDQHEIKQLNDYAMTKWVNEMQVLNSAEMFGTESVRVRLFNTYGPGEYYSPYRSAVCLFIYRALHKIPYTVYLGHHRTSTFITDTCRTLANIADRFKPGEVYNIGGGEYHDMKEVAEMVHASLGIDLSLVTFKEGEPFTTKDKKVDVSKAERDLGHAPRVTMKEGIPLTIEWMKKTYNCS